MQGSDKRDQSTDSWAHWPDFDGRIIRSTTLLRIQLSATRETGPDQRKRRMGAVAFLASCRIRVGLIDGLSTRVVITRARQATPVVMIEAVGVRATSRRHQAD